MKIKANTTDRTIEIETEPRSGVVQPQIEIYDRDQASELRDDLAIALHALDTRDASERGT